MKNFMNKANILSVKAAITSAKVKDKLRSILSDNKGEGFVDTAVRHVSN